MDDTKRNKLNYLKNLQSVEGDLEIAKMVVSNDDAAVHYFLGEFSKPFLNYIGREIMKVEGCYVNGTLCYYPDISADYYTFIGAKFINQTEYFADNLIDKYNKDLSLNNLVETKLVPTWHKVALYKGIKNKGTKDARLYTYINTITVRYFITIKKKLEKNREEKIDDMLESQSVSILKDYDGFDEIILSDDDPRYKELKTAWDALKEKYRLILKYLVIENRKPLDIFDEMVQYIKTEIPPEQYTVKQKQDAMSLLKNRAKKHLRKLILKQRVK